MTVSDKIKGVIDAIRRRTAMANRLGASLYIVSVLSASVLLATLLFGLISPEIPPAWAAALLKVFSIAGLLAAIAALFIKGATPGRRPMVIAMEKALGGLNNELIVSYELIESKKVDRNIYSDELASAHISRAAERISSLDFSPVIPWSRLKRSIAIALTIVLMATIVGFIMPEGFRAGTSFLVAPDLRPDENGNGVKEEIPLALGDVEIRYEYPSYTERGPSQWELSDGSIKAIKGSIAYMRARSADRIANATARLEDSNIPATVTDFKIIEISIPVMKRGSFKLEATGAQGEIYTETSAHKIEIVPDKYPKIELVSPKGDVEVEEAEVLELTFHSEDDFGIKSVDVVYWLRGREDRVSVMTPESGQREVAGTFNWDIGALGLKPGDRVRYYVEVTDNDEVSGPKKSASNAKVLEVFDPKKIHGEIVDKQWELLKKIVHLLGDELIHDPPRGTVLSKAQVEPEKKLHEKIVDVHGFTVELLAAMKDDRYSEAGTYMVLGNIRDDLDNLADARKKRLDSRVLRASLFSSLKERETPVVERDVIDLDKTLERQKLLDFMAASDELLDAQRSISDLLAKAKSGDKDALAQLEAEIERMKRAMAQMMEAMAKGSKSLPEEFLNTEALKQMPMSEAANSFDALQKAINDGDIESALEMAKQLQNSIARMMSAIEGGMRQFGQNKYGEQFAEYMKIIEDIDAAILKQRKIYEETQKIGVGDQEEMLGRQEKKLNDSIDKLHALVEELTGIVKTARSDARKLKPPENKMDRSVFYNARNGAVNAMYRMERDSDYVKNLLETRDMYRFKREILTWDVHVNNVKDELVVIEKLGEFENDEDKSLVGQAVRMREIVDEILKMLDEILISPDRMPSRAEKKRMDELSERQLQLEKETAALEKRLKKLREEVPMICSACQKRIGDASKAMNRAGGKLGESSPNGALPHEAEALKNLEKASENLKNMGQGMGSGMGGGMFLPMPMGGGSSMGGNRKNGYQTPGTFVPGKVMIPGRAGYKVPEEYRKEILRAMRNKSPEKYRELNRDYYRKLVE